METQVTTMTTTEVANRLVQLCREGKNVEAIYELYSDKIISIEPTGLHPYKIEGKISVIAKNQQWQSSVRQVNSIHISDPVVSGKYFSCSMDMEVTMKDIGKNTMNEICVYEVENGKIILEQFFFSMQ